MSIKLDRLRIIEIMRYGKFYVLGSPKYIVIEAPNADPNFAGFIIVQERFTKGDPKNIHTYNCVWKLDDNYCPVALLLIKNREMAEEICFACNRLRI